MILRKNFFYYFAVLVYIFCILFAIVCVFNRIGEGQEYPYLIKGAWLIGVFSVLILLMVMWALSSRLGLYGKMSRYPKLSLAIELLIAGVIILVGARMRYMIIRDFPMTPDSDYKTYYEMAVMIHNGTLLEEGVGYCDYVAMFPHVYGYPAILSSFFDIMGVSVHNALIFNLICSIGSMILVWLIAHLVCGRFGAITAVTLWSFLPSVILYSDFVASEPLFTFILLLAALLFVLSLRDTGWNKKHVWFITIELVLFGLVLAFGSFIRPMAILFLISSAICMLAMQRRTYDIPKNDVPLGVRITDSGWKRCLIVLFVYLLANRLFTMHTAYSVDRELAGGSASFGYNLLTGLNLQSYGGWNQDDADYLYDAFDETGSAQEAQMICRDMAFERLKVDPRALLDLFVHKYEVLWGNDDYGASWNILFMDQQGNLTEEREDFLYRMMDISDLIYLFVLLDAGIYGFVMFRLRPNAFYACTLLFLGTVGLHLMVENQNRYHYHALPFLVILAGAAGVAMKDRIHLAVMARIEEKKKEEEAARIRAEHLQMKQKEEVEIARLRSEALHAQFDMWRALVEGHIRIIASKAVEGAYAPLQPQPAPAAVPQNAAEQKKGDLLPGIAENIAVQDQQSAEMENIAVQDPLPAVAEDIAAEDLLPAVAEDIAAEDQLPAVAEDIAVQDQLPAVAEDIAVQDQLPAVAEDIAAEDQLPAVAEDIAAENQLSAVTEDIAAEDQLPAAAEVIPAEDQLSAVAEDIAVQDPQPAVVEDMAVQDQLPAEAENIAAEDQLPAVAEDIAAEDLLPAVAEDIAVQDQLPAVAEDIAAEDQLPAVAEDIAVEDQLPAEAENITVRDLMPDEADNNAVQNLLPNEAENITVQDLEMLEGSAPEQETNS